MTWDRSLQSAVLRRQVPITISVTLQKEAGRGPGEKTIQGQIRARLHERGCLLVAPEMHQRTRTLLLHNNEEQFQICSENFPPQTPAVTEARQDGIDLIQMQRVESEPA
jgi:hypothetical protein